MHAVGASNLINVRNVALRLVHVITDGQGVIYRRLCIEATWLKHRLVAEMRAVIRFALRLESDVSCETVGLQDRCVSNDATVVGVLAGRTSFNTVCD
jgi:hypothetical protein